MRFFWKGLRVLVLLPLYVGGVAFLSLLALGEAIFTDRRAR